MKRALLLAALLMASACSQVDPAEQFAAARKAFDAEDYVAARTSLVAALDADSAEPEGTGREMLLLLARAQLKLADGDGAQATLVRLEEAGVRSAEIVRMKAEAAILRGQPDAALTLLGQDDDPEAWRVRAAAHTANDEPAAALDAMRRGLERGGNLALLRDYAVFLMAAEDLAGAQSALAKMRSLGPDRLDTLMVAGDLAARQDQLEQARQAYQAAKIRFPSRSEPLVALALLAERQGKLDQAIALVEQAAVISPRSLQVEDLRVYFASQKGDWEKVRAMLVGQEAALDMRSAKGLSYAEALLRLGHAEQARALYARALSLSPQSPYARFMLAEAALATGDAALALRTVQPLSDSVMADEQTLELAVKAARAVGDPSAPALAARLASPQTRTTQALLSAAETATERKDWPAVIAAFKAIPGHDGDAEVLKQLALACSKAGLHGEAIAFADKALIAAPRNPDMPHTAGLVRVEAGLDAETARELISQAVRLDPANRLFRASLARAGGQKG